MNREIIFRGMSENKWYYGLLTFMFGSYAIVDPKDENIVHLVDEKTVGQYIGRKDENDDCIFEEDIASVIIQRYVFGFYQETEYVGIVKYDEKECVYYLDLMKRPIESGETIPDEIDGISISSESDEELERFYFNENIVEEDIRISGNIYNNPELLEDIK